MNDIFILNPLNQKKNEFITLLFKRLLLISILLATLISNICNAQETINFIHLDKTFSQYSNVAKDTLGLIWISEKEGIYKYDGYDYNLLKYSDILGKELNERDRVFFTNDQKGNFWLSTFSGDLALIEKNGTSISLFRDELLLNQKNERVTAFYPDKELMWLGSANGTLFRYNYTNHALESISTIDPSFKEKHYITSIASSGLNILWLATLQGKIYSYKINENCFEELKGPFNENKSLIKICSDDEGKLWIATEQSGLFVYDYRTNECLKEDANSSFINFGTRKPMFISIFCDSKGNIWTGTDGDGLLKISQKTNEHKWFKQKDDNKFSISDNTITAINEDLSGNLWFVSKKGLIDVLPSNNYNIEYYSGSSKNIPQKVLSILKTKNGDLWIGTDGKGLKKVSLNNQSVQYNHEQNGLSFFPGRYIQALEEDNINNIWIGTYQNGLFIHNPRTNQFKKIEVKSSKGESSSDIRYVLKDSQGRIWVTSNFGIHVFSDQQKILATFDYNVNNLNGSISESLIQTVDGNIWIALHQGGLYKFIESNNFGQSSFKKVIFLEKHINEKGSDDISYMTTDAENNLYLNTVSGSFHKYSSKTMEYKSFENIPGIKNIFINSLLIDDTNKIWLSSNNGLHVYDQNSFDFKSYYFSDGLQNNNFSKRCAFEDSDGIFYFGGENGVSSFRPEKLKKLDLTARLHINEIEILNKPISSILPNQVSNGVNKVKSLELSADQSSFSFQFSAIDNVLSPNFHYSYRLKGFDEDWIDSKNERKATYTNIPKGDYTFQIRAGSRGGIWDITPKSVNILIHPSWWKSNWAYTAYIFVFMILIISFIQWLRLRNNSKKEAWLYKQEKQLFAFKMDLFTKMSHEINTPLTLILGPIDDMLTNAISEKNQLLKHRLTLIKNNAERLSRISTELLAIRDKELNKLKLYPSENNIIEDLNIIAQSFVEQARFKNIDFIKEFPENEILVWYDKNKMEHVFYNLLSNAFKFTPIEGTIFLKIIRRPVNELLISVINSGPGISKQEQDSIFNMFYQSETGRKVKGMGIGLALCKELVELHHGHIRLSSEVNEETNFTITLSTNPDIFSETEKLSKKTIEKESPSADNKIIHFENEFEVEDEQTGLKNHSILIVEDNVEMQIFLVDILYPYFNVILADNGEEGYYVAKKQQPSIIISDIMMPIMDGVEMSKKLKNTKSTSHIPLVLLTAKNTTKSKLQGLKSGAIAYLQKPFNTNELLITIFNIISNKESTISKSKTDAILDPQTSTIKTKDNIFMESLVNKLNAELENEMFKLEELTDSLNMSYSAIYRKCQDITGKSLVEFFRYLKLRHAAVLILENGYNISEAGFMVGYKDSKYFTKCFKDEFGKTPGAFKREVLKEGLNNVIKRYRIKS